MANSTYVVRKTDFGVFDLNGTTFPPELLNNRPDL
jgi:hypothetical protein